MKRLIYEFTLYSGLVRFINSLRGTSELVHHLKVLVADTSGFSQFAEGPNKQDD